MDDLDHLLALRRQGFFCSQVLLILGMELQGKDDPDLVRVVHGLAGGIGFTGELCGALTGGACLLSLYAGKGRAEDDDDPRLLFMLEELMKWFKGTAGSTYGGIRCDDITAGGKEMGLRCAAIVIDTFQKVKELLVENEFDLAGEAQ